LAATKGHAAPEQIADDVVRLDRSAISISRSKEPVNGDPAAGRVGRMRSRNASRGGKFWAGATARQARAAGQIQPMSNIFHRRSASKARINTASPRPNWMRWRSAV